jgi:hypothetical protein
MKEEMAHRVGVINVGALTTLETFGRTNQRKMMVINLDQLAPYQGAAWDEQPLGRSSRNGWSKQYRKTEPRGGR